MQRPAPILDKLWTPNFRRLAFTPQILELANVNAYKDYGLG